MSGFFEELWGLYGAWVCIIILCVVLFLYHLTVVIFKSVRVCAADKGKRAEWGSEGVSVIITSNNRAEDLRENLPYFLEQNYPEFEVIVVDECSEDDTQDVLAELQQKYPNLRTSRIYPETKFRSTKKIAINIGVLAAQYDVLLFSEISCRPSSDKWIGAMQSYFTADTAVVCGYANYSEGRKGMSIRRGMRFLRFLRMFLLTKAGCYVMGDGRNMGYRKRFYLEKRGFSRNSQSYVGFDHEMVGLLSGMGKVKAAKDEDTRVVMNDEAKKTWCEDYSYYYVSRRSWPSMVRWRTGMDDLLRILLYVSLVALVCARVLPEYAAAVFCMVYVMDVVAFNVRAKSLKQRGLFPFSMLVGSVGFLYRWTYNLYSVFTGKKWK